MPSSTHVARRMNKRVSELIANFTHFIGVFESAEKFSGPSLYFHHKALNTLSTYSSPSDAIQGDEIFDWLYAMLASWGMHRMGQGNTKLRELDDIKSSVRSQTTRIRELQSVSLHEVSSSNLRAISMSAWGLLSNLTVSIAEAKLVANSKVLHHLLPNLIPPIDRTYTFKFFYDRKNLSITERDAFFEMFLGFNQISRARLPYIHKYLGIGWHTSVTKVVDNAIIGYVLDVLS